MASFQSFSTSHKHFRIFGATIMAVTLALLVGFMVAGSASSEARTFKPTRYDDPHPGACKKIDCSLREAVMAAEATPKRDVIVLRTAKTYQLSISGSGTRPRTGDLDIHRPLTIRSAGGSKNPATIRTSARQERVFEVFSPTLLKDLRLVGRSAKMQGGGIQVRGSELIAVGVTISKSRLRYGGAISMTRGAWLRLVESRLLNNRAHNAGGGISADDPRKIEIIKSQIVGNTARRGGGLYAEFSPESQPVGNRISVEYSSVRTNTATASDGGGFLVITPERSRPSLRLTRSTVSGNSADRDGGGLHGFVEMKVSTIAGNTAAARGGGLLMINHPPGEWNPVNFYGIHNATFARNTAAEGAGIFDESPGVYIQSSIVVLNRDLTSNLSDCGGNDLDSGGFNLTSIACGGLDEPNDLISATPGVNKLADNGGWTKTAALDPNSPARDAGKVRDSPGGIDQRGVHLDSQPDIGAYEYR